MNRRSPNLLASARVLLVEDDPDEQRLMAHLLTRSGANVILECNGEGAIKRFRQTRLNEEDFDAILMDLQMPITDGLSATVTLRDEDYQGPIIAITAHGDANTEARWRAAGCTAYLTKPFNPREFAEVLNQAMKQTSDRRWPRLWSVCQGVARSVEYSVAGEVTVS